MPITYETAGPVGAFAAIGTLEGRRQLAAAAAQNQYGGGHGYGGGVPYDTGIQDAIQFRDSLQSANQRHTDDVQSRYDLQRMQGEQQMAQDRQRFQLQAQLQDVELSQQERMRLQRLKNSVGEVMNDSSLTDQEKSDYISQIKYNIDPLQRRIAQEKLGQEKALKDSMVQDHQAKSALQKQTLDIMAKSVPDRTPFIADPSALAKITEDFTKNIGPALKMQFGDQAAGEMIGKMAQQEALKQGLGTHAYMQPDGKLVPFDKHGNPVGSEGAAGSSSGGTTKKVDHPSGVTAEQYDKIHAEVIASVDKKIAMREKDAETGGTKPVYPQDPDWRAKSIESEFQARIKRLKDYNDQAPSARGYKSPFTKPDQTAATPAAAATSPSAPRTPKEFVTTGFDTKYAELQGMSGISDDEKQAVGHMMKRAKEIVEKYPDPAKRPEAMQKELANYSKQYQAIKAKGVSPPPPAPTPAPGQAPAPEQPWWQRVGNVGDNFYGAIKQSAPPPIRRRMP